MQQQSTFGICVTVYLLFGAWVFLVVCPFEKYCHKAAGVQTDGNKHTFYSYCSGMQVHNILIQLVTDFNLSQTIVQSHFTA